MGKKIVFGALVVIVIAVAAAILFVRTQLDGRVAAFIESYGRAATGTDVDVGSVDLAVTDGRGSLDRLTIGNPDGFATDYALRIDDIELAIELGSLADAVPVVSEMLLNDAHLNAEQSGADTNLTQIQRYMEESSGEPAAGETEEGRIIIDRFRLSNARVTVTSDLLTQPEVLQLEDVVVEGIGRRTGGATYAEATEAILDPILSATRDAVEGRLRETASDAAREELEEEVEEVKEDAEERVRELLDRE
jgi:hypothetical protein